MRTPKNKKIQWRSGAFTYLYLGIIIITFLFAILIFEKMAASRCLIVATTRADAIAESTAVYSQSYDYNYNENQARIMADLLAKENQFEGQYEIDTTITFPEKNELTVQCTAHIDSLFPAFSKAEEYQATSSTTVKSVNVFGHLFVIP